VPLLGAVVIEGRATWAAPLVGRPPGTGGGTRGRGVILLWEYDFYFTRHEGACYYSQERVDFQHRSVRTIGMVGDVEDMFATPQAARLKLNDLRDATAALRMGSVDDGPLAIEIDEECAVVPALCAHELYGGAFNIVSWLEFGSAKKAGPWNLRDIESPSRVVFITAEPW
jgi:hypothetical protein